MDMMRNFEGLADWFLMRVKVADEAVEDGRLGDYICV